MPDLHLLHKETLMQNWRITIHQYINPQINLENDVHGEVCISANMKIDIFDTKILFLFIYIYYTYIYMYMFLKRNSNNVK